MATKKAAKGAGFSELRSAIKNMRHAPSKKIRTLNIYISSFFILCRQCLPIVLL